MSGSGSNGQAEIKTIYSQFTKTFSVYEVATPFRITELYEAVTEAANGTPCTKTSFTYDGASTRILKTKEESFLWDATWDI